MSSSRDFMRLAERAIVFGVAIAGCSSSSRASTAGTVARSDIATTTTLNDSVGSACTGFVHRYVGGGLTVDLPTDVAQVSGEATSDPGPIHASETHDFVLDSATITIGRRIGSEVVNEPLVSERVSNGVVLYVRASNDELRACLLASMLYDRDQDMSDE
jgi:hypothetical protein